MAGGGRSDAARRERLLAWYRRERRALPWRASRDPYAIWISEAMLQQTRVETVVDYWRRFLARFPGVRELAAAREEEVLALWSGLGYYRRARSLHAAAKAIVERHGGEFPREAEALRELPGVGPYTAGAVLSIAFDRPEALVDGNVVRVLSRWFAHDAEHAAAVRWAWEVARELVPARGAGDWNQALMELGATICTPREPACAGCPVAQGCAARRAGRQVDFPRVRPRAAPVAVELALFVVERGTSVLMEQRPAAGRMAGLWQVPTVQLAPRGPGAPSLFPPEPPLALERGAKLGALSHSITRHRIRAELWSAGCRARRLPPALRWVERAELPALGLTGLARKALAQAAGRAHRRALE